MNNSKLSKEVTIESQKKDYKKLYKVPEYDIEAVDQLAEALNEIAELEQRIRMLKALIDENSELHPFVWRTAENVVIAIHNLEDDHFSNILQHLLNTGRPISKELRAESVKRNIGIPANPKLIARDMELTDREDVW